MGLYGVIYRRGALGFSVLHVMILSVLLVMTPCNGLRFGILCSVFSFDQNLLRFCGFG